MLIRRASLLSGRIVDIRVDDRIREMADKLTPNGAEQVLDAARGLVIPGLHDHHVHLRSAAAAFASVRVGPPYVFDAADMSCALTGAARGADGWIRAIGYHESVAGVLDRAVLDTLGPASPVRVQHRSGAVWTVNSAGLAALGVSCHPDGRLWRSDIDWTAALPRRRLEFAPLSRRLAEWGVTGLTDATPNQTGEDIDVLALACRSGELRQRLHCMAPAGVEGRPGVTIGPMKIILDDDSLDLDALQCWIEESHARDRAVAVHAVTDSQLVVTIAALRGAGVHPLDRIEHAAVVPGNCIRDLADLGATVVTQPNFVAERGDQYVLDIEAVEHEQLWRVASLLREGVKVAFSTDVPFGDGDPWAAMRAAVDRRTPSGVTLGIDERVTAWQALTMFLGQPDHPTHAREVGVGQRGDLCVLAVPPEEALDILRADHVAATIIGGDVVHRR